MKKRLRSDRQVNYKCSNKLLFGEVNHTRWSYIRLSVVAYAECSFWVVCVIGVSANQDSNFHYDYEIGFDILLRDVVVDDSYGSNFYVLNTSVFGGWIVLAIL